MTGLTKGGGNPRSVYYEEFRAVSATCGMEYPRVREYDLPQLEGAETFGMRSGQSFILEAEQTATRATRRFLTLLWIAFAMAVLAWYLS